MSFLLKPTNHLAAILSIKSQFYRIGMLALMLVASQFSFSESKTSNALNMQKEADIRLLIDISGSMKKNDPANLRIPAVSLLTELIPDGDKAGVWTFGQWVNNLVRSKVVDDAWRADAKEQAKKINSVALYTNIGAVLEKASDDFSTPDKDFSNTHFILLTDGMVDIDRDAAKNDSERERVLTSVLSTFKDRGAKIHAVSLSKNADLSLMDKLAIQTGGQSAVAESSEELTKVFVQALNQAVPSEEVPIEGNEFVIDSSIEEFTALIFRGDDGLPTEIISPDESIYQYGKNDPDVKWFQDRGYDLITITRPLEGTWTIKSDIQPESRVTVVSNLQLDVSKLPANFFAGEQLKVDVSFIEDDKRVTNPDFLSLLDIQLQLKTEEGKTASKSMSDLKNPPADGFFSESITKLTKVGQYEVTVLVDGKTFKRSKRQVVNLRAPFDFEFSVKSGVPQPYYELVVTPLNDSISLDETTIFVKTKFPDSTSLISALEMDEGKKRWVLQIPPDKGDGVYEVAVKVKSQTSAGQEFQFKPKPFEAEFPIPVGSSNKIISVNEEAEEFVEAPVLEEEVAKSDPIQEEVPEIEPPVEPAVESEPVDEATSEEINEEESSSFWWLVGGAITGGILLLAGLVYFVLKKRKAKAQDVSEEILSDADVEGLEDESERIVSDDIPIVEEPLIEEPVIEEEIAQVEEDLDEDVHDLSEDLDFMEAAVEEPDSSVDEAINQKAEEVTTEEATTEEVDDDLVVDLSADDLNDVIDDLEVVPEPETESEELDVADIAQAIEDSADEPDEVLDEEVEKALDINDDDDDDDDEEFNLEDFDIGDTDDLSEPEDKKP